MVGIGESEQARAAAWFETLRDRICAAFEEIEDAQDAGPFAGLPPGRFARKATRRGEGDGGDESAHHADDHEAAKGLQRALRAGGCGAAGGLLHGRRSTRSPGDGPTGTRAPVNRSAT